VSTGSEGITQEIFNSIPGLRAKNGIIKLLQNDSANRLVHEYDAVYEHAHSFLSGFPCKAKIEPITQSAAYGLWVLRKLLIRMTSCVIRGIWWQLLISRYAYPTLFYIAEYAKDLIAFQELYLIQFRHMLFLKE
jgi:hypothetical protein